MKLKFCSVLFFYYCSLMQASEFDDQKQAAFSTPQQAVNCELRPRSSSVISSTSQLINDMNRIRLNSQELEVNTKAANLLIKARTDRTRALTDCAEKLRVDRVSRATLKDVCTKLQRHLNSSPEDTEIDKTIEAIRSRFYQSTGSSVYNINPVWWFYSDREIRTEGVALTRLIIARLTTEQLPGVVEAQGVQESTPYEDYDDHE